MDQAPDVSEFVHPIRHLRVVENSRDAIANCLWDGEHCEPARPSQPDVHNALCLVIDTVLPRINELVRSSVALAIRRDDKTYRLGTACLWPRESLLLSEIRPRTGDSDAMWRHSWTGSNASQ